MTTKYKSQRVNLTNSVLVNDYVVDNVVENWYDLGGQLYIEPFKQNPFDDWAFQIIEYLDEVQQ